MVYNMCSLNVGGACNHKIIIITLITIDWGYKYAMKRCREKRDIFLTGRWGWKLREETTFEQQLKKKKKKPAGAGELLEQGRAFDVAVRILPAQKRIQGKG